MTSFFTYVLQIPIEFGAPIFTGIVNVAVFIVMCYYMRKEGLEKAELPSFCLCFMTAIYVPWYNSNIALGQGGLVNWHNPTTFMIRAFAIVIFFMVVDLLEKRGESLSWKSYIPAAVVSLISLFAKPNFFQGFVPALGCFMLIDLFYRYKGKVKQWFLENYPICLVFVPSAVVVVWQFIHAFYSESSPGGGIGIKFGYAMSAFSPNIWISALLGNAFALCFLILYFKKVVTDIKLSLAYIFALVSWLQGAFLYEKGERYFHGNLGSATQLACIVLWMLATVVFLKDLETADKDDVVAILKTRFLFIIWMLHLVSGLIYAGQMIFIQDQYF